MVSGPGPFPGLWSQVFSEVYPSSVTGPAESPVLDPTRGEAYPQDRGYPPRTEERGTLPLKQYIEPGQLCDAGSVLLAFTQEDFLVAKSIFQHKMQLHK